MSNFIKEKFSNNKKNDNEKLKIVNSYLENLNFNTIYDEAFYIICKFYIAELSRSPNERWLYIKDFDNCPNVYKIIPKLILWIIL